MSQTKILLNMLKSELLDFKMRTGRSVMTMDELMSLNSYRLMNEEEKAIVHDMIALKETDNSLSRNKTLVKALPSGLEQGANMYQSDSNFYGDRAA